MLYIINDDIKFNTNDYVLEHIPTADFIKLALPAGRLLEMIIKSNGEVLSREEMLTEVWDNYGLRGSSNNLSQYLSTLRKSMADFGCHELIITLPKVGIVLNKTIDIRTENNDSQQLSPPVHKKRTAKNTVFIALEYTLYAVIIGFLYLYYTNDSNEYYKGNEFIAYERVINNDCRIIFSKDYSSTELTPIFKEVNKILSENSLRCNKNTILYFDHYPSVNDEDLGRTLLSYCNIGPKKDITSCDNVYYYDRGYE